MDATWGQQIRLITGLVYHNKTELTDRVRSLLKRLKKKDQKGTGPKIYKNDKDVQKNGQTFRYIWQTVYIHCSKDKQKNTKKAHRNILRRNTKCKEGTQENT